MSRQTVRSFAPKIAVYATLSLSVLLAGCGASTHVATAPGGGTTATAASPPPADTVTQTVTAATTTAAPQVPSSSASTPAPAAATSSTPSNSSTPTTSAPPSATPAGRVHTCYPAIHIAATHIPGTTIPATTIPATNLNGTRLPAVSLPAVSLPATTLPPVELPATDLPGGCYDVPRSFAITNTTVRVSNYGAIDPGFSQSRSQQYWNSAGPEVSIPDPTAPGFGQDNAAGFPRNQYVRPYVRSDGTMVSGYWRNDPTDGLPTCQIVSC
jgi:hypothetical protein